jgi:hypothetical protein
MKAITVSIVRWVDDEPQPGIVECQLTDRFGKDWTFLEKCAVVSAEVLPTSIYPQEGVIACRVLANGTDHNGREFAVVDTEQPCGVEADDGNTRFEVFADRLVELAR